MTRIKLLLGDEALAEGALQAGIGGVYAYPGTPSTEITEYIQHAVQAGGEKLHCTWSSNEKTAMEAALGMSYAGCRSLVCMKHVGMNVAADAFVNAAMTGVNAGLVVVAADDPSMHSSQNEQDSRFYGKFAMIPTLEPSTQQEAYEMIQYAFELSEEEHLPVLLRLTTRLAHSRAAVAVRAERAEIRRREVADDPRSWVLLPANARRKNQALTARQPHLERRAGETAFFRELVPERGNGKGIVACGTGYNYVMENRALEEGSRSLYDRIALRMERRVEGAYPRAQRPARVERETSFAEVVWLFTIGSLAGDITETIFCRLRMGVWMSRSSLVWGPFSIVWGAALVAASVLLPRKRDGSARTSSELFVLGTLMGGAYEYVCSALGELVFGVIFWDYSAIPFNLGGRINLLYCFFWGFAAVAWVKLLHPHVMRAIGAIRRHTGRWLTAAVALFMAVNMAVSGLALIRSDARSEGAPAANSLDVWLDARFPDERMARIYPNMKKPV